MITSHALYQLSHASQFVIMPLYSCFISGCFISGRQYSDRVSICTFRRPYLGVGFVMPNVATKKDYALSTHSTLISVLKNSIVVY